MMQNSTPLSDENKKQFKLTGWHFLFMMLGFFATIIMVNIVFVTSALDAFSGLVVKNSYVASQFYNEKIEQAEKQKSLGWQLDLLVNDQGVDFILLDKQNKPISKKLVTLNLLPNRDAKGDIHLILNETEAGHYTAKLPADANTPNGVWWLELDVLQGGELFYHYEEDRHLTFKNK
ncbi:MAG: FixH family protein [Hyphomicrobiales bacterium]